MGDFIYNREEHFDYEMGFFEFVIKILLSIDICLYFNLFGSVKLWQNLRTFKSVVLLRTAMVNGQYLEDDHYHAPISSS